jgi:hypothetical protein
MDTPVSAVAPSLAPSALKVQGAADRLGLAVIIRQMPGSTRTAEEAAAACGCDVGQIVKSLVFAGAASAGPISCSSRAGIASPRRASRP